MIAAKKSLLLKRIALIRILSKNRTRDSNKSLGGLFISAIFVNYIQGSRFLWNFSKHFYEFERVKFEKQERIFNDKYA